MTYEWLVQVGDSRPAANGQPSASPIYRNKWSKDGFPTLDVKTLYESFTRSVEKYPNNPCLGSRAITEKGAGPYTFLTYKEVSDKVHAVASAIASLGAKPGNRVGVYSVNCVEWMLALQACNRMSYHCVPIYDTLGENAIEYIVNHSESVIAFVCAEKLAALAKAADKCKQTLKSIVYWGKDSAAIHAVKEGLKSKGLDCFSMEEFMALGAANLVDPVPPKPEDVATIMYTSGTTDLPKGVILTHAALCNCMASTNKYLQETGLAWGPSDSLLSYLPLAHIFDRVNEEIFLYAGAQIGYWQGDITKLVDDIGALKPTLFLGVPRVFDRIYKGVITQIDAAGGLKKMLFNWGCRRKSFFMKKGYKQDQAAPFFDKLVFSKIKQRLGGRVRAICSGGAPLAPHVEEFLRTTMCCMVVQGYGLTETSAASFIAIPDVPDQAGTVGPPTPGTEFCLESVVEMNYDALSTERPAGEVLVRSGMNFSGYYKQDDKTAEVLEKDGWFHTGDIGIITKDGALKIVDRKKNIFKLSQGEYIAVEKLEAAFKKNDIVDQVWVYGDSFRASLVAVVVPVEKTVKDWAKGQGIEGDFATVCKDEKVKKYVMDSLNATGKAEGLKGFEMIKALLLETKLFSVEDDLMTPTFKLKRPQLRTKYQPDIDVMYAGIKD